MIRFIAASTIAIYWAIFLLATTGYAAVAALVTAIANNDAAAWGAYGHNMYLLFAVGLWSFLASWVLGLCIDSDMTRKILAVIGTAYWSGYFLVTAGYAAVAALVTVIANNGWDGYSQTMTSFLTVGVASLMLTIVIGGLSAKTPPMSDTAYWDNFAKERRAYVREQQRSSRRFTNVMLKIIF